VSYIEQWNAIAARIRSLRSAANVYAQYVMAKEQDNHGTSRHLRDQYVSMLDVLRQFHQSFHVSLPPNATACLEAFINGKPANIILEREWCKLDGPVPLTAFEAEMSFLLSDT
jgi:hypothetical protein